MHVYAGVVSVFRRRHMEFMEIRISIIPEILIRIRDHFRLTFQPWRTSRSLSTVLFAHSLRAVQPFTKITP